MMVTNTIPTPTERETKEYVNLVERDERKKVVCGLVAIVNKSRLNFEKTGEDEGYQLTFRSLEEPDGYVNHWFKASSFRKGNMFKTLVNMTDGKLRTKKGSDWCDDKLIFQTMMDCLDKWYEVKIVGKPWGEDKVWVSVIDCQIEPVSGPGVPPSEVFETESNSGAERHLTALEKDIQRRQENAEFRKQKEEENGLVEVPFDEDDIPFG
jgi:hypothetical protein